MTIGEVFILCAGIWWLVFTIIAFGNWVLALKEYIDLMNKEKE